MKIFAMALTAVLVSAGVLRAQEVVGYASGQAARLLSAEDRARLAALPIQDLVEKTEGRYTHLKDDGRMGHWGLDAVRARQDVAEKPYRLLLKGGVYQTERIVFADPGTGATLMKLTNTPYGDGGDEICYFGKAAFNAEGSLMTWIRSKQVGLWGPRAMTPTETHGPIILDGDGSRPRIVLSGNELARISICHPTDPDHAYSMVKNDLVEVNLRTGEVERVVKAGVGAWHLKLSPDGKYACSKPWSAKSIWIVELKTGQQWNIPLTGAIHDSYRFVPGDTDWIMYWYEGAFRKEGFVLTNFKTGRTVKNNVQFDWNHGDVGRYIGVHTGGYITPWDGVPKIWRPKQSLVQFGERWTDSGPEYSVPVSAGGYLQHWPDDQLWAYPTRYTERPWLSEIQCIFAKPFPQGYGRVNRFRVCFSNLMRGTDRKGNKTIVLDRPNISRDGTKLIFNSNVFGQVEVYLVVLSKPMPPTDVTARWVGPAVNLTWKPPKYHQEIKGYHVYRSTESGRGFERISDEPVVGTSFTDTNGLGRRWSFYAVRSVEHSKLESGLSAEAMLVPLVNMPVPAPALRLFVEAERAIPADLKAPSPDAIWLNFDGLASDLHYIWQRRKDKPGKVSLTMNVPRAGDYTVVARVKGKEGAAFTIAGQAVETGPSGEWRWVRSQTTAKLVPGKRTITIESSKHGSCLDCFYLSTDAAYNPTGRMVTTRPGALVLAGETVEGYPKLSWRGPKDERFHHYNLYCSSRAGARPGRETLIASPDVEEYLDWQALGGRNCYKVTQVTLDGLESPPSNEVSLQK